jgi:Mu transposase-like protein
VSGRWWRTLAEPTMTQAQASLDRFLATTADTRPRQTATGQRTTVGALAAREPLRPLPTAPYPATVAVERTVADNATVAFRGTRYSVPPGLGGVQLTVRHRLGPARSSSSLARRRAADQPPARASRRGQHRAHPAHHAALERVVLGAFTTARPCDRKANRPPGPDALAEAARLLVDGRDVVVDLADYHALIGDQGWLTMSEQSSTSSLVATWPSCA